MRRRAALALAALTVIGSLGTTSAVAQSLLVDGYTESTFGNVAPGIFGGQYPIYYTDANGVTRKDAGIEVGEGSYNSRNFVYWRFDNVNRRHGNLYDMNSTAFTGITTGQIFSIADLRYFNAEVFATNSSVFNLPVAVKANFTNLFGATSPTFNFDFRLTFTNNRNLLNGVDDTLEFVNAASAETFNYGNKTYALRLNGFSSNGGQTYTNTFQLPEWQTVTSSLFGSFEEVSGPRLYVNPADRLVFQARVGTSRTQTLEVSNSGAANTTLTGTIEGAPVGSRFTPTDSVSFSLGTGQSTFRDYVYTPTARSAANLEYRTINVVSNASTEDVVLVGQGVGPVYSSAPNPGGTINVGRVLAGAGAGLLPISNTTNDGDLVELTDMTLRSLKFTGTDGAAFNLTGIADGRVLRAGVAGATGTIGTKIVPRGTKTALLTVDTDVDTAFGADGRDFAYTVNATVVEKRQLTSTPVAFGRVMLDQTQTGLSTTLAGTVTPDNFFTNPVLKAAGAASGGVTIASDTTDRVFSINTGTVIATRGVTGRFIAAGVQAGAVPVTIAAEGLSGEGTYSLSVPFTATTVRKRTVTTTSVDFGRVVAGQSLTGFSTTVGSPVTADNFFTYPTLQSTGGSAGGVTIGTDTQNRTFDKSDGSVQSLRGVIATFATPGAYSGTVPLDLRAEGLTGEGTYSLGVNYSAQVVGQRVVSATPVSFGRVMVGGAVTSQNTSISSPTTPNNLFTNPILRSAGATDGTATVGADSVDRIFNRNDGATISTRGLTASFASAGTVSGSVPLQVDGEGLAGEAAYPLSVGYTGTAVRKREASATTVDFGRFIVGQSISGLSTTVGGATTPDNFYTNPVLDKDGATDSVVTVSAGSLDRTISTNNGSAVSTRTVGGTFNTAGAFSGSVPLSLRAEGLAGEGTYDLSVPYVAEAVRQRTVSATTVQFGRVVAGGSVVGFQTQISSPTTVDNFYTRPTLSATGASAGAVTILADTQDRTFDRTDGGAVSTRGASATFSTTGAQSGSVPLTVVGEGLAGESAYLLSVPWTASVVQDRVISATPVDFGKVFKGTPVSGTSQFSTTGNDSSFTRVRLNAGSYLSGPTTVTLPQSTTFAGPSDAASSSVGATFTSAGVVSGSVGLSTTNGGVTGEGLAGETPRPVAVNYSADVYNRGVPSFSSGADNSVYTLNFGTIARSAGTRSLPFSFFNFAPGVNTAGLEFDGILSSTGSTTRFLNNLPSSFTGFTAGSERAWSASIDTSAAGTYNATYRLAFNDDRSIQGAAAAQTLTLNLTGTITGGFTQPPRTTVRLINPSFESLRFEASSGIDVPLGNNERTLGFSNTFIENDAEEPRFIPGWFSNNEVDAASGIVRPPSDTYAPDSHGGDNVAYVNGDSFRQNAIGTFNTGDLYDFSFRITRTSNAPFFAPNVNIFLSNSLFVPLSFDRPTPGVGEWVTWRAAYRVDAGNPLAGGAVSVRIAGDSRSPVRLDDFLLYIPGDEGSAEGVITTWTSPLGGSWSETAKWSNGVANGIDGEARLSTSIVAPSRINLDTPVTLGKLRFESTNEYNVSGPGTLRMNGTGAGAQINVVSGSHVISAQLVSASNLQVNVAAGNQLVTTGRLDNSAGKIITKTGAGSLFIDGTQLHGTGAGLVALGGNVYLQTDAGANGENLALSASGTGVVSLNTSQNLKSISVGDGGLIRLEEGGKYITTGSVAVGDSGSLDLTDGYLIVDYENIDSPTASITAQIARGFNDYSWTGSGITSSLAAQDSNVTAMTAIGVLDNSEWGFDSFGGRTLDGFNQVLVRYTFYGDANLDGVVDGIDVSQLLVGLSGGGTGWAYGDFDYSGFVDGLDVSLLLVGLGATDPRISPITSFAASSFETERSLRVLHETFAAVPEPASVGMVIVGGSCLLLRRRQRPVRTEGCVL